MVLDAKVSADLKIYLESNENLRKMYHL